MLSCKDITTEAHHLIDGELGLFMRLRVRFHLLICKYCRRYVNQLKIALGTLKNDRVTPISEPSETEIDALVTKLMSAGRDKS